MFDMFFPDEYVASTYVIPFEELYEKGYRGVLFDIDNTLVPHGAPADERAKKLFARLKEIGFSCCLISNNQEPRVKMFNEEIQVPYIYNAHKPSTKNYRKAMELMGTDEFFVCGGSVIYRCSWCKACRNAQHFSEADASERRDSDCFETVSGADCASFLQEKAE